MKKIFILLLFFSSFAFADSISSYKNKIDNVFPLNLKLNGSCSQIENLAPVFSNNEKSTFKVIGGKDNFLVSCFKHNNKIFKINLYNDSYVEHLGIKRNDSFEDIFASYKKIFKPYSLNVTEGLEYKLLEIFVNEHIYQIIVYNKIKKEIEFISFINPNSFPEYKYIGKMKEKKNLPPLISWLFN